MSTGRYDSEMFSPVSAQHWTDSALQASAGDGDMADLRVHGPPLSALLQEGLLDKRRNLEAGEVTVIISMLAFEDH